MSYCLINGLLNVNQQPYKILAVKMGSFPAYEGDEDSEQKQIVICEALGYSLLASTILETFFIFYGNGSNGKSVLFHVLEKLVGPENVSAVQPSQLDNRFQRAHLFGKFVNLVTEIPENAELADAPLKSIVSGEKTTAEHKHQAPFDFHPFSTCWFGTNHLPHCRDFSDGTFRRAIIIGFNRKFEGKSRDIHLKSKLEKELSGILNLALEALAQVLMRGAFSTSSSIDAIKAKWRLECDPVREFVEECCLLQKGASIASSILYKAYEIWAIEMGMKPLGRKKFTLHLEMLGVRTTRSSDTRFLIGICLKADMT